MSKENSGPAFPGQTDHGGGQIESWIGMTLRQYAAIKLKVADSGEPWLDAMLERSRRDKFARAMLASVFSSSSKTVPSPESIAKAAYTIANAMIGASK